MFFDEYIKFKAFISDLACFHAFKKNILIQEEFLGDIAELTFDKCIMCISKKGTYMLDGVFLQSAIMTLNSITVCCNYGCFADANVLIRKYRDDLFLYLFIIDVLNNRKALTGAEIDIITNGEMNTDKFISLVDATRLILEKGSSKDLNDKAVDAWFDNDSSNGKYKRELSIDNYLKYLKSTSVLKECILEHGLDSEWGNIRRKLNDYTHNNGKKYLISNLSVRLPEENIEKHILSISNDISFITSVFLVVLILIRPDFIASTDYADYLDEIEPPDDSQYWVAPFIQEYIDQNIVRLHPELKSFLITRNNYGMKIE